MSTLGIILAGGQGSRLYPLTKVRAKPAVTFAGSYRIIDFVLSNFTNSGFLKLAILTQYKPLSLMGHLRDGWTVSSLLGSFIQAIPPGMENDNQWYEGTADAVYQNLGLIKRQNPEHLCVFGGDHIYKMDIRKMIHFHEKKKADLTISAVPIDKSEASQFGIIEVDEDYRMFGFEEKPQSNPKVIPGRPNQVFASMGNYVFNPDVLCEYLEEDQRDSLSEHDFGKNIIPKMLADQKKIMIYDFSQNRVQGMKEQETGFWKDVGTLDSYWETNMQVISVNPVIDLYNRKWPIRTYTPPYPPAKFVHNDDLRKGHALESIIGAGTIVSGSTISSSVIGSNCRLHSYSDTKNSIVGHDVTINRTAKIKRCILDTGVTIGEGVELGYDLEKDRQRENVYVTDSGLVIVEKEAKILE